MTTRHTDWTMVGLLAFLAVFWGGIAIVIWALVSE